MESKHIKKEIFLGFNAYTESDADIFKGRDADIEHLYDLVSNKDYVLCYAESGEGKSSLLDAGLTPRLRTNRYFPVKIAFTDEEYNNNNIVFDEVIKSRIMEAVSEQQNLSFVPKSDSIFNEKYSNDLWWFLRNNTLSLYGISFTIVLIFDQFEEVINYPKSDAWTSRFFAFLEKISSDDCPQYILDDINATVDSHDDLDFPNIPLKKNFKAIFSIRTEYIGELDYWCMQRYFIPDLKHNRFCLKPLTLQGADEVMRQYEGFDAELRDSIKDVLLRLKNKDNRTADDNNVYEQYIPALILSIVCTSLYQNSNKVLTDSLIADSIENFYNDKIKECNISLEERNTIASVLVDKDKRVRVASDCSALEKIKFNKKYKDALLRNRLIKKSNVNGVEYIELVHDSLIDVVKKHKEEAIQKELRKKRRRNVAIFSIMTSIILLFVILIIGLKKNEKNFLITQAKFIAAEAEKLVKEGDRYMCIKLLDYVGRNNKYSLKKSDFEHAMRSIDCNYKLAEKCFIHEDDVVSAVFSPDGRYVVTASDDNTSKIWSVETGDCMQTLSHEDDVRSAVFSPDGRYVVTASGDKTSKVWSVETGDCLHTLSHEKGVVSAVFSSDGRYVVTASDDETSKIWSVETGDCLQILSHESFVKYATFSADGRYVVTASWDNTSKIWLVETGDCLHTLNHEDDVVSAVFSSDGRYVVTASYDKTSKIWSVETGECLHTLSHESFVIYAAFSSDGRYVVTASGGNPRMFPFFPLSEILDKWSEILGPNAELTEEEKGKYFLN